MTNDVITETAQRTTEQPEAEATATELTDAEPVLVEDELLVEEVSIDGMCGVY